MPPKKIDPNKLLKKAIKEKTKQEKPQKPTIVQPTKKPLIPAQIKQEKKYEEEIRTFFEKIKNIPLPQVTEGGIIYLEEDPSEIIGEMFDVFAGSHPSNYWPTKLIDRILISLDPLLYVDFATKYLSQDIKNVKDFFNSYVDNPKIAERLRTYYEQRDIKDEELARLQAIADEEFAPDDEIVEVVFGPPKKPSGYKTKYHHTKYIDKYITIDPKTGEEIELPPPKITPRTFKKHKQKVRPPGEVNCKQAFLHSSWLGGFINSVYISPPDSKEISELPIAPGWERRENIEGGIYYLNTRTHEKQIERPIIMPPFTTIDPNIRSYINSQQAAVIHKDTIWYPVNQIFFDLLCNPYSTHQEQDGEIFSALERDGKNVRMKVGFGTNKGFIILNEELFAKWKKYKKNILVGRQEKLTALLKEPFNPILKELGENILSSALHKIAPQVEDYGYTKEVDNPNDPAEKINILITETQYINTVLDEIVNKSTTNEDFIKQLAMIVGPLDDSRATLFHTRIIDRYYLPEMLTDLSLEEIYPAVLSNTLEKSVIDSNLAIIESKLLVEFNDILNIFYKKLYPTERSPTLAKKDIVINLTKGCVNPEGISQDKRIYYRSSTNDTVYCLDMDDIIRQLILTDTYINPATGMELDPGFLQQFRLLYHKDLHMAGYKPPVDRETPTGGEIDKDLGEEELAPGLLDLLFSKLDQCEKEITDDKLTPSGKCPAFDEGEDTTPEGEDTTPEGEDTTPEGEDTTPEGEDTTPDDDDDSDSDSDDDTKVDLKDLFGTDSSFPKTSSPVGDVCEKCHNSITNKNYKTIKLDDGEYHIVKFCGPECFEKYNKFSSKHGKRGRNGTKERKEDIS